MYMLHCTDQPASMDRTDVDIGDSACMKLVGKLYY